MKRIIMFGACVLLFMGCAKQLDEIKPKHAISSEAVSEADLTKLTNGVLNKMENFTVAFWNDGDYHGENLGPGPGGKEIECHSNLMSPSNPTSKDRWQVGFVNLMHVNELLKSANAANPDSPATKQAKGTAYFCRAYIYYQLVMRFGGVPILRTPSNEVVPVSKEDDVWAFIISDLLEAEKYLDKVSNVYRPSDEACWAFLSKVYLWTGGKANAVTYADKVISSSFELSKTSNEFASMFISGNSSKEVVFALANKRTSSNLRIFENYNDTDRSWGYAVRPDLVSTLFADSSFGTGDIRKEPTINGDRVIKFPNGEKDGSQFIDNPEPSSSPIMLFRLADAYLTKAEAQGPAEGLATMKTFMENRYSAVNLPDTMSEKDFQNLVLDENNREFYAEGRRYFDIKRNGRTDLYEKFPANSEYLLHWPIPQVEIDLVGRDVYPQNPGY